MPDLDDVLWRAEDHLGTAFAGATMATDDLVALTGRVRARRVRRRVLQVAVALPVVAALALGGVELLRHVPAPEAVTPPPSTITSAPPSPSATPTSSSSPTSSPAALLPAELGLPPLHEMPDGLLARTGPGWVLAAYASRSSAADLTAPRRRTSSC